MNSNYNTNYEAFAKRFDFSMRQKLVKEENLLPRSSLPHIDWTHDHGLFKAQNKNYRSIITSPVFFFFFFCVFCFSISFFSCHNSCLIVMYKFVLFFPVYISLYSQAARIKFNFHPTYNFYFICLFFFSFSFFSIFTLPLGT